MRQFNTERLLELSRPKQINKRQSEESRSILDQEIELGIPKGLRKIDENSASLKKLKYKDQFLQAIKGSQMLNNDISKSPHSKKHKKYV